jgi:hypothetical protein
MTTELAERPESALQTSQGLMPALSFNQMALRYNAMQQMAKEIMRSGADYGVIPGTSDKPTLLKPGAEKLCALFGLRPMFVVVREVEDWDKGIFYYWYKCQLYSGDRLVGEGEGSANSKEKKYRWRNVYPEKATEEEKRLGKLETRKGRNNSTYKVYVVENTEPFDLINTLQKMAQKRALVAATLIVTSASDFFTQDVEDMVDVEFRNAPVVETGAAPPIKEPVQRAEAPVPSSNGNGAAKRGDFPASALHSRLSSMGMKEEGARHHFAAHVLGREVDGFEALGNDERWQIFDEYKAVQMKEAQPA